jgi:CHASE3 domain sensor protein
MRSDAWLKPPRQVFVLFLGVAVVSFGALGTLAWQLLESDRKLEVQRRQVQLESAADQLVGAMQRSMADLQTHVGGTRA